MKWAMLAALMVVGVNCAAQASLPESTGLVTDGNVTALLEDGGNLYAAGSFEYIGSATGSAVLVNQTTGAITSGFPRVEGDVLAILPDGAGGWYLGGNFTQVGVVARAGLARVTAALAVDSTFVADVTGTVRALELTGGVLYLGGSFSEVGGQGRSNVAAVDGSTGAVQSWAPVVNATVYALETDGSSLYMGGSFSQIDGNSRSRAGAVDTGGTLTSWQPPFQSSGDVRCMLLDASIMYIGGSFISMSGYGTKNRLVAVDATTGLPIAQLSRLGFSGPVHTIVKDGNRLYCGGAFGHRSVRAAFLASVDPQGQANPLYPDTDGVVNVVIPDGAGGWYVGGDFTTIGGVSRGRLARLDASGVVDATFVPISIGQEVRALTLGGGSLYVGHQNTISRLDPSTGAPVAGFSLQVFGGIVRALHLGPTHLYVGGTFTSVTDSGGNFSRFGIVDVDPATGNRVLNLTGASGGGILALAGDGTHLYVGGGFGIIGGVNRTGLAAIDMATGVVTSWDPAPNGNVETLQVEGSELIVGGAFNVIAGSGAARIARFGLPGLGRLSLALAGNGAITHSHKLGNTLYVVGNFTELNGQVRLRAAALDLSTGALLPWTARASVSSAFNCIATNGTEILIACNSQWFEYEHASLAAIDLVTQNFESWNPQVEGGVVLSLAVSGSSVFYGGGFTEVDGQSRRYFAASDATTGNVLTVATTFSDAIQVIAPAGGDLLCGGYFRSAGGVMRDNLAEIDLATHSVTAWDPQGVPGNVNDMIADAGVLYYAAGAGTGAVDLTTGASVPFTAPVNGPVNGLALDATTLWLGGSFTHVGYFPRDGHVIYDTAGPAVAAADPAVGQVFAAIPDGAGGWFVGGADGVFRVDSAGIVDVNFSFPTFGDVWDMRLDGSTLYVCGEFVGLGGAMRTRLAAIDVPSATVLAWDPAPDQDVFALEVMAGRLYVGGKFDNIAGAARPHTASFDTSTLTLNSWQPAVSGGYITSFATDGTSLFASGYFNTAGGSAARLAQLDPFGNTATGWAPSPSGTVFAIAIDSGKLYVGGDFTTISGSARTRIARYDLTALTLDAWAPTADEGPVAFAFSGSIVLIGGGFGQVNGQPLSHIAELDVATGALGQTWPQANNDIGCLAFSGSQLFAGGEFTAMLGESRPYLASFDRTTLQPTNWMPAPDGVVHAVALDAGVLYCGGAFTTLAAQARHGAGSFSSATGMLGAWSPDVTGTVRAMQVNADGVYLAGSFTAVNGSARGNMALVDKAGGANSTDVPGFDGSVYDVWERGGVVLAGGLFLNGGASANKAHYLDPSTGAFLGNQPQDIDGDVLCVVEDGAGGWFIGGTFTRCNGLPRNGLARIDSSGAVDTAFNADLDAPVRAMLRDGNTLYVGGDFVNAGSSSREHFAAIDIQAGATYGQATSLNVVFDDTIHAFALSGTLLYVGGAFTDIGGNTYERLARIDLSTGMVDSTFNPSVTGTVRTIALNNDLIMAGGSFSSADGQTRSRLAAWEVSTLALSAWNPTANQTVYALVPDGLDVFVGGSFTNVGFQSRNFIALLDANPASGTFAQALAYDPDPVGAVFSIALQGSTVYMGGSFTQVGASTRVGVAATDLSGNVLGFSNPIDGNVWAIAANGSAVIAAGDLTLLDPQPRMRAACIARGALTAWQPAFSNNYVSALAVAGDRVYAGGSYLRVGALALPNFSQFDCPPLIGTAPDLPVAVEGANYSYFMGAAGGAPAYTWSSANLPGWLSLNPSTGELSGVVPAIAPATLMFDVTVTDQNTDTDQIQLTLLVVTSAPLNITTPSTLPDQYEGFPITGVVIQASGGFGTLQWSLTGAPGWLSIGSTTGQLSGTPPGSIAPTTINFTVEVLDSLSQMDSQVFQFDVPVVAQLVITTASPLSSVNEGSPISIQINASGGVQPYQWALQNHPGWLSINPTTGLLTGTPPIGTGSANILFDIVVTDARPASVAGNFDQPVAAIPQPSITTSNLPAATVGSAWTAQINATGGTPAYTFEMLAGPDWINVNTGTGELMGTPYWGLLGTFSVVVRVRDSYSPQQEDQKTFSLAILEAPCTAGTEGWETNKPALTTPTGAPAGRHGHTAVWTGTHMIVWGGAFSNAFNTGGIYDPATDTWVSASNLNTGAGAPAPRSEHAAVWTGKYMFVWGGVDGGTYRNTGGLYDPSTDTWLSTPNLSNGTGAPSGRRLSEAVWTGRYVIVFGGQINAGGSNKPSSGGIYDPVTDTWLTAPNLTTGTGAPAGRVYHTLIWTGSRMLVWGGIDQGWGKNDGGHYDPATDTWTLSPGLSSAIPGFVTGRYLHQAVWTGGSMIVWGGTRGYSTASLRDGVVYDPGSDSWTQPAGLNNTTLAPAGRQENVAVYCCGRMIVYGGTDENTIPKNNGGVYDAGLDQWISAPGLQNAVNAPSARRHTRAVWTGAQMLIWGGTDYTGNGGSYVPPPGTGASTATVSITAPDVQAQEAPSPTNFGVFTLQLSPAPTTTISVGFTMGGTASTNPGTDYTLTGAGVTWTGPGGSITVPPLTTSVTITVTPVDDALSEGTETVQFQISSGTGYTTGSPVSATVNLLDDEGPSPPGGNGDGGGDDDDGGCSTGTGGSALWLMFAVGLIAIVTVRRLGTRGARMSLLVVACCLLLGACAEEEEEGGGGGGGGNPAPPVLPSIVTTSLADGEISQGYSTQIQGSGGAAPYTWAVTAGSLPPGLSLSAAGTPASTLSGTPTSTGTFNFDVTLTDANSDTDTVSFGITINDPPLVITTSTLPEVIEGGTYSEVITASGGTGSGCQWQIVSGSLPPGLSLATTGTPSAAFSGSASTAGVYSFTVEVTDSASNTDTAPFSITVHAGVQIDSTAPVDGLQGSQYTHTFTCTGGFGNFTWSHAAGPMPPGLSLSSTTGTSCMLGGVPSALGTYVFTVRIQESGGGTYDLQTCTVNIDPALVITTTSLPGGLTTGSYTADISAVGGNGTARTWAVVAGTLPPGLSLGASGNPVQLSGTLTQSGQFDFTVEVSDINSNTDTQVLTVVVDAQIDTIAGNGESTAPNAINGHLSLLIHPSGDILIGSNASVIWCYNTGTSALTVFAGTGTVGYSGDGGAATSAEIGRAECMAIDSAGNVYFGDPVSNTVRMIDATTGNISTVAGNGTSGYSGDGGSATSAQLNYPEGVVVSSAGDIYISDRNNARVRVVSSGVITTFAGTGTPGYSGDNGQATQAQLNQPSGLALDSAGRLLICDDMNHRIRRVESGTITTICGIGASGMAGDGAPAVNAQIARPTNIVVDVNDHVFFSDHVNHRVRRIDSVSGYISTRAGIGNGWSSSGYSGDGGAASTAELAAPRGLVFNGNDLLIADSNNSAIRVVDGTTFTINTLGTGAHQIGDNGQATSAIVGGPTGVARDLQGNLLVAASSRVRRVDATTGVITTIAGTDYQGFSGDGGPATSAMIQHTGGIDVDSQGNIYFADVYNHRIRRIDASTGFITTVAGSGATGASGGGFGGDGGQATAALLDGPRDVAVDAAGNLYIADSGNNRIRFVNATTGVITTFAGTGYAGFGGDNGQATAAYLRNPEGVCLLGTTHLVIADSFNHRVRAVDLSTNIITTWAGNGTAGFSGDGNAATNARFSSPRHVTVDAAGAVYVADEGNDRIRRFTQGGTIATIAGGGATLGDTGPATSAELNLPLGIRIDGAGNLLIADAVHGRVRIVYTP